MISKMSDSQLERVMEIWLETNLSAHDFVSPDYWKGNFSFVKEVLPQSDVYVYTEDETIKGFAGVSDGEYLSGIFVDSRYQSSGIGKKLLDYLKERYPKLVLHVYEENSGAVRFYKSNSFAEINKELEPDTNHIELEMQWER